jgi:hypothetical protein
MKEEMKNFYVLSTELRSEVIEVNVLDSDKGLIELKFKNGIRLQAELVDIRRVFEFEKRGIVERNNWEGREIREDGLLNISTLELIEKIHGKIEKVERHFKIGGMEVDTIIYCKKSRVKRIGLELKEFDINKALEQAVERRKYFNYFYIVLKSDRRLLGYDFRSLYLNKKLDYLLNNGIGLITVHNGEAFLIFPSYNLNVGLENFEMNKEGN